MQDRC